MELILNILQSISYVLVEPTYLTMFVIIGIMFYLKNKKISMIQRMTLGESVNSPLELTLSQLVLGVFAGVIGSILLGVLGVVFTENSGVEWIFLISILLIFIQPRFVCFSYSASILGALAIVSSLIAASTNEKSFLDVNILQIMTMVGVLHIVEALLVAIDGKRGAIPVFTQKDSKIVGGFAFDRIWAIPIALLVALSVSYGSITSTPNWWPIINNKGTLAILGTAFLTATSFYGMIGYKTVTFTQTKNKKIMTSALLIGGYGLSLILVAQLAGIGLVGEIIVVAYAPLAHEGMIRLQRLVEKKGDFLYFSDENGISILEVAPSSPAFLAGIRRGDKIVEVNNQRVISEVEVLMAIKQNCADLALKIRKVSGEIVDYSIKAYNKRIGILIVPRMINKNNIKGIDNDSNFKKLLDELRKK